MRECVWERVCERECVWERKRERKDTGTGTDRHRHPFFTSFRHPPSYLHPFSIQIQPHKTPVTTAICHRSPFFHHPFAILSWSTVCVRPSSHVCYPDGVDMNVSGKVYVASNDILSGDPSPKADNLACPGWDKQSLVPVEMKALVPETVRKRYRRAWMRRGSR